MKFILVGTEGADEKTRRTIYVPAGFILALVSLLTTASDRNQLACDLCHLKFDFEIAKSDRGERLNFIDRNSWLQPTTACIVVLVLAGELHIEATCSHVIDVLTFCNFVASIKSCLFKLKVVRSSFKSCDNKKCSQVSRTGYMTRG